MPPLEASAGTPVSSIAYDSRKARAGSVFVALRGANADGTGFAREAIGRGAIATLSESAAPADVSALWVQVPDARLALAALSAIFHDDPSERLILVGITGTNGKTTTSYLLGSIFEAAGIQCGRIGTVGYRIGRKEVEAERTTPEAPELQAMLREMVHQGCGACVMEVSSHALALKRVDFLRFSAAIFTNLTRDHLDFHRNMDDYFAAKRRLFALLPEQAVAVVNLDDRRAGQLTGIASPNGDLCHRRRRGRGPGRSALVARRADLRRAHAQGHGAHRVANGRPRQRLQHPGGGRCGRGDGPAGRRRSRRASAGFTPCRAGFSSSPTAATTFASWSTMRTPTTR